MRKKAFDCVEFQHWAGEQAAAETRDMTVEEKVAYYKARTEALRKRQRVLRRGSEAKAASQRRA